MVCVTSKNRRAFTFLEIMFVVVIIGILTTMIAAKASGWSDDARKTSTRTQIGTLEVALGQFELKYGRFPTNQEGLEALVKKPSSIPQADWNGPLMNSYTLPKDAWNRDFEYEAPGEHSPDYDITSAGPDGQTGTEDDIRNS